MDLLTAALQKPNNIQASQKREAIEARPISTQSLIRPTRPSKSHLAKDPFYMAPVNGVLDIRENAINIKKGLMGKGNDHDLGKINDFAMKAGALGLAAYLFTKARTPMSKTMEFVGFGSFFASMALWPKLFIETPLKAMYGINIHQKYVDNEGRKKMFFQDPQYVPWDLYTDKQLDKLGNRLGVPKNIHNRNEVIKDKAHKIALQGNTLWMLTAGFATPLMSALICNQAEKYIQPVLDKARINNKIKQLDSVEHIVTTKNAKYNAEPLIKALTFNASDTFSERRIQGIVNMIAKDNTTMASETVEKQVWAFFKEIDSDEVFKKSLVDKFFKAFDELKKQPGNADATLYGLTKEKALDLLKNKPADDFMALVNSYLRANAPKINLNNSIDYTHLTKLSEVTEDLSQIVDNLLEEKSTPPKLYELVEGGVDNIKKLAKSFFGYVNHKEVIKETENMLVADTAATLKANSWLDSSRIFCRNLNLSAKETETVKSGGEGAIEVIIKKLDGIALNHSKYQKALKSLVDSVESYDKILLPAHDETGNVQGIQSALEKQYNKLFDKYAKEFSATDKNGNHIFGEILEYLIGAPEEAQGSQRAFILKNLRTRIDSMRMNLYHMIHTMDVFKRLNSKEFEAVFNEYCKNNGIRYSESEYKKFAAFVKKQIISTTAANHTVKFDLHNPEQPLYKRFMDFVYKEPLDEATEKVIKGRKFGGASMDGYMSKYLHNAYWFLGDAEFPHEFHLKVEVDKAMLLQMKKTDPVYRSKLSGPRIDQMIKEVSSQVYNSSKWLKMFGGMSILLAGITLLAETNFGKVSTKEVRRKKGQN